MLVFDLGLSSIQLDDLNRGFSFKSKNELNMSMGQTKRSAKEVLNTYSIKDLKDIIKIFGEEEEASKISNNIVKERAKGKINTTDELVKIIKKSKRKNFKKKIDLSTKTFQAIRIFVNQEISELIEGIINATKVLKPGKTDCDSFHSIGQNCKILFKIFKITQDPTNIYLRKLTAHLFDEYKNKIIRNSKEIKRNPRSRQQT